MKKIAKITSTIAVLLITCICLIGCVPKSYEKAVEHLEKAGYLVTACTENDAVFIYPHSDEFDGATAFIVATNGNEGITMLYFENSKKAKAGFDKFKEFFANYLGNEVIKREGKVIYAATEDALKAVR